MTTKRRLPKLTVTALTDDGNGYVLSDGREVYWHADHGWVTPVKDIAEIVCDGRDLEDIRVIRSRSKK